MLPFWRFLIIVPGLLMAVAVYATPQQASQKRIDSLQKVFFQAATSNQDKENISWEVFRMITQQFLYKEGVPAMRQFLRYAEQPQASDTLKAAISFQWALIGSFTQGTVVSKPTEYFLKARDLSAKTGNHTLLIAAYVQLLNNLYRARAYEEVERIGAEAMQLMETWDITEQHVEIYNTLALAYEKQNKLTQALAIFDKGVSLIQRQAPFSIWHAIMQGNKGSVLHQMGRLQEAIPLLEFDVKITKEVNYFVNGISSLSELAEINARLGRMRDARAHIDTVFQWIKITGDENFDVMPACIKAYKRASAIYQQEGRFSEAIYYLQKAYQKEKEYDEYMLKAESLKIRRQYDLEKSESELKLVKANNDLLAAQKNRREIVAIIALAGLLLLSGLLAILFRQRNRLKSAKLQIEEQLEEIRQNNQKLQELDRFKRLLTGAIVHDLKNPLATMIQQTKEPATAQAARRMMNMTLNILEVDKLEELKYHTDIQKVALTPIIQQTLTELNYQITSKQINVRCSIPEYLYIQADVALTERIFINLISNALRFTPAGGSVAVQVEQAPSTAKIIISVADTGCGIPQEALPHIFDKFFQVNPVQASAGYRSNGLGLTFCKLAMEAQGGCISVASTLNKGTTFYLTFVASDMIKEVGVNVYHAQVADNQIKLSAAERSYLQPFAQQLRQKELYELGEIRQLLAKIDVTNTPQIQQWVEQVQTAALYYNESAYFNLLSFTENAFTKEAS